MTKDNVIEKQFLVVCDVGPLIMTDDKDKAINSLKAARIKGHRAYLQEITASSTRIKEIGKNLFKRKVDEEQRKNILSIRAKVVRQFLDTKTDHDNELSDEVIWKKITKNNKLIGFVDLDDFSQWTLDVREFNPHDNPKLTLDDGTNSEEN
jgi:hypothetical protein